MLPFPILGKSKNFQIEQKVAIPPIHIFPLVLKIIFNKNRQFSFKSHSEPYEFKAQDADPCLDPSFQKRLEILKMCSKRLIFHSFWLVICKLMRIGIRIQLITLTRIRLQLITFMRIRILPFNLMRIHADPDPQHCKIGAGPIARKIQMGLSVASAFNI